MSSPTSRVLKIASAVQAGGNPLAEAQKALRLAPKFSGLNALIYKESKPECKNTSGLLAGVPITLKDNLLHAGRPAQAASRILEGYTAPTNAHVVKLVEDAGAVIIGRSNMDEFAMGSTTESSCYGPCLNPWDTDRVPGGSSGGAAALVAAGLTPIALGSSTGGSVRQPASYCGVVGLKPSYGSVSRRGLIAYASSLDVVAPIGASVKDVALAFQAIAGPDLLDETSNDRPPQTRLFETQQRLDGLRIGILEEGLSDGNDNGVNACLQDAAQALKEAGASLSRVSLSSLSESLPAYYILAPSEASSNLSRFDGVRFGPRAPSKNIEEMYTESRTQGFGKEVQRRILMGTFCLSAGYYEAYYGRAKTFQSQLKTAVSRLFQQVDLLLLPTTPTTAPRLGAHSTPEAMYLSDIYTVCANLCGIPAISVPCGLSEGLPVGAQLMAPFFEEDRLFQAAGVIEAATGPLRPN
jgi:aspartyl-tRNA(Asn)/glutamyl-tRNA(Gln) amidotransferase subunit A